MEHSCYQWSLPGALKVRSLVRMPVRTHAFLASYLPNDVHIVAKPIAIDDDGHRHPKHLALELHFEVAADSKASTACL